jgi:hypothetical protein
MEGLRAGDDPEDHCVHYAPGETGLVAVAAWVEGRVVCGAGGGVMELAGHFERGISGCGGFDLWLACLLGVLVLGSLDIHIVRILYLLTYLVGFRAKSPKLMMER